MRADANMELAVTTYRYRIYYEPHGPSVFDMIAEDKTPADLDRAFERFPTELEYRLEDHEAVVRIERCAVDACVLTVIADVSEEQLKKALAATLDDWRLFGSKLE
jgi:hypothetical protein